MTAYKTIEASIYRLGPGVQPILKTGVFQQAELDRLGSLGRAYLEGIYPDNEFGVEDGQPVPLPRKMSREDLAQAIKDEARSRIMARWPVTKQLNVMAEGGTALTAMRAEIDSIRAASNALEAMDPIPADYADSKWWPERTA